MRRLGSLTERTYVVVALGSFATLAILSMREKNPTFDETTHIAAGISYVQTGDFRMNPEHPVLPKLLAGVTASLTGVRVSTDTEAWRTAEQWDFGREVLYESGVDWRRIVFAARLPMVAIGVLCGLTIWLWARAMVGSTGAAVALALYALSPNFLAHTRLVTTDVPLTFTVVGAVACLWSAWRTGRRAWILAAAGFIGLSMVTKFSAFSYAPVYAILAVLPSERRGPRQGLVHLAILVGASAVLAELFVFVTYGFANDWTTIRGIGMAARGIGPEQMSLVRRLPYELMASVPWPSSQFAIGLRDVITYTEAGHPTYLLGQRGSDGWWWMPFVAWGAKTPLPFLLLTLVAVVLITRSPNLRRADLVFLLAPAALVLATNVAAKLGLGVRHLMPMFPFLMILSAWPLRGGGFPGGAPAAAGLLLVLVFHLVGTVRAHPHYLPYFNEVVGGAKGGYRILGDSNLDWGQDLSAAADFLRARGVRGAILCYFGTASPFAEDIEWQILPPAQRGKNRDPWTVLPSRGPQWLVMSATNRQGIYYLSPGGGAPYPWLDGVEPAEVVGGTIFLYEIGRNADVQWGLAETYRRHGLAAEAEAALERRVDKKRFDVEARKLLVEAYLARGDSTGAVDKMWGSPNPDASELLRVASIREALGDRAGALRAYEVGLTMYKWDYGFKNDYAWYLQKHDLDLDLALELTNATLERYPDDPYYLDTRAMVRLKRGENDRALEDVDAALARPGGDLPELRWHRALIVRALGRRREATAEARRVLARDDASESLRREIEGWLGEAGS